MDNQTETNSGSEEAQDAPVSQIEIVKGELDQREYYFEELKNGARLLIVSDPDTETSVCGIRMEAGSYQEPDSHPGLAHYLEHMLFMGSEKYPKVNDYDSFIQENGGSNNAYTDNFHTVFTFDVTNQDSFCEALDRTLQFFVKPLFNPKYIAKELSAVHNEYESNLADDNWIFETLMREFAAPNHIIKRFNLGNSETLKAKDTRDKLISFYNNYYSANLMTVVLYSDQNVASLRDEVVPLIESVPNRNLKFPTTQNIEFPFPKSQLSKFVKYKCVGEETKLTFTWFLPSENSLPLKNCYTYFSSLFTDNWEGSLAKTLTDEGLINSASSDHLTDDEIFTAFFLTLALTAKGEAALEDILSRVGSFCTLVQQSGVQHWYYDELKGVNHLNFRYSEKREPEEEIDGLIADIPSKRGLENDPSGKKLDKYQTHLQNILRYGLFMPFDGKVLQEAADQFKSDNLIIFLAKKDQDLVATGKVPYFNTVYECRDLSATEKTALDTLPNGGLRMPSPNPLMPSECSVSPDFSQQLFPSEPLYFEARQDYRLVYYRTSFLKVPKTRFSVTLRLNKPEKKEVHKFNGIFGQVLYVIITRQIAEVQDLFLFGGDRSSVQHTGNVMTFTFDGYTSVVLKYIPILLQKVQEAILSATGKEDIFKDSIQQQLKTVNDKYYSSPVEDIANTVTMNINDQAAHSMEANLRLIKEADFEDFKTFVQTMLEYYYFEFYASGFINQTQTQSLIETFCKFAKELNSNTKVIDISKLSKKKYLDIQPGKTKIYQHVLKGDSHVNGGIRMTYFCPGAGIQAEAYSEILNQYLSEPFFYTFRTEMELGYTCYVGSNQYGGNWKLNFTIVSAKLGTNEISNKIQQFIEKKYQDLQNLEDEEFSDILSAVENNMTKLPVNIGEDWSRYQSNEVYQFRYGSPTRLSDEAKEIMCKASKESVLQFYSEVLLKDPRLLEVHVLPESHREAFERAATERVAASQGSLTLHHTKDEGFFGDTFLPVQFSISDSANHPAFAQNNS